VISASARAAKYPALLKLLATPAGAAPLALSYLRVIFVAMPAILILVLLMMGMRGAGDAMTPLWAMLVAVILDSGLNPVFILGLGPAPKLGIAGSATATLIANYTALVGLVGDGVLEPTAQQVAARAGVGIRTVFRRFSDVESLFARMSTRMQAEASARHARNAIAMLTDSKYKDSLLELATFAVTRKY